LWLTILETNNGDDTKANQKCKEDEAEKNIGAASVLKRAIRHSIVNFIIISLSR
jgi:hypothetical protein